MSEHRLTAVFADDERLARDKLRRALTDMDDPSIKILAEATNGSEALHAIEKHRPDFAVLDIQMPGLSGMDVARNLTTNTKIIFATAFDQFAVRAFEVNAVDYLLKPYDPGRLRQAIHRISHVTNRSMEDKIRAVVKTVLANDSLSLLDRVPSRIGQRIKLVEIGDISWFDTKDSVTFAHTKGAASFDVRYSLDELEQRLDPRLFFRSHRSHIINIRQVAEIIPWFNGQFKIKMKGFDGTDLSVSRGRVSEFRTLLNL